MTNFIFSLGFFDKKLFLPLIYMIIYIVVQIFWNYTVYNEVVFFLENFGFSIGQILTCVIGCAFKYKGITKKKTYQQKKNYFRDYSVLFLIDAFYLAIPLKLLLLISRNFMMNLEFGI